MSEQWDGRPENPERDGEHAIQTMFGVRIIATWSAKAQAFVGINGMTYQADPGSTYLGPCLTPAEVVALQDRLEMRHVWQIGPDGQKVRVEVEPGSIPDGIACRDETIRLLDQKCAALRAEAVRLQAALRRMGVGDLPREYPNTGEGYRAYARDALAGNA